MTESSTGIILSFDDGPTDSTTARILDLLEENGGRAVFFPVGERIRGREALLRRMVSLGCEIGNHTWHHDSMSRLTPEEYIASVKRTNEAVFDACGTQPVLLRPAGGVIRDQTLEAVRELGMSPVLWTVDPEDWKTRNTDMTVTRVLSDVREGRIVLLHDLYPATAAAAEILIPELIRRGFSLSTVGELVIPYGGLIPGHKYYAF